MLQGVWGRMFLKTNLNFTYHLSGWVELNIRSNNCTSLLIPPSELFNLLKLT
ncbi:hypothetical protein CRC_01789 [Cylindrospermopsis raciborskii CS-505]|nr:hypothetical protein CRC_01789 [Cylindrospermopsis raciborskii CS-505]